MIPAALRGRPAAGRLVAIAALVLAAGGADAADGVAAGAFRFVDAAAEAGLGGAVCHAGRPGKDHLLDSAGAGAAFLDYDRDGLLDVYLPGGFRLGDPAPGERAARVVARGGNRLFRGRPGGVFEDVTERAGAGGEGHWAAGAFAADHDGDGWTDILVTNFGPCVLYRNRGDGTFVDVARAAGLETSAWHTGAAFFDADADGDLDLYLAAYIDCTLDDVLSARPTLDWKGVAKVAAGPFGMKGAADRFFRREAGGRYVDATAAAGLADRALGFGFAVLALDFDGDGDLDLYVANDSDANYLYRNDGKGVFQEVGLVSGAAFDVDGSAQASMGLAAGDVDGDGLLDIAVTNFAEDHSTLYRGLAGGFYDDRSKAFGVHAPTFLPLSWGCVFADLDSDGDLDLAIANGHIYPQVDSHPAAGHTYAQRPLLLENLGDGRFAPVAEAGPGFAIAGSSRGLAAGDTDNDGDVDLLLTRLDQAPLLLRNEGPQGAWLVVVLEDENGPLSVPGATVRVTAGGRTQRRDVAVGDSFLSTHDPRLHFGLGAAERADEVRVRWPDGAVTVRRDVAARQLLRVRKGP